MKFTVINVTCLTLSYAISVRNSLNLVVRIKIYGCTRLLRAIIQPGQVRPCPDRMEPRLSDRVRRFDIRFCLGGQFVAFQMAHGRAREPE